MPYIKTEESPAHVCGYLCTSESDIPCLPRFGIPGTNGMNSEDEEPCNYNSEALVVTGSSSSVHKLMPNNEWTRM